MKAEWDELVKHDGCHIQLDADEKEVLIWCWTHGVDLLTAKKPKVQTSSGCCSTCKMVFEEGPDVRTT